MKLIYILYFVILEIDFNIELFDIPPHNFLVEARPIDTIPYRRWVSSMMQQNMQESELDDNIQSTEANIVYDDTTFKTSSIRTKKIKKKKKRRVAKKKKKPVQELAEYDININEVTTERKPVKRRKKNDAKKNKRNRKKTVVPVIEFANASVVSDETSNMKPVDIIVHIKMNSD